MNSQLKSLKNTVGDSPNLSDYRQALEKLKHKRSRNILIPPILEKSFAGLEGYGGGHEYACGASIKERDFKEFIERMKKNI